MKYSVEGVKCRGTKGLNICCHGNGDTAHGGVRELWRERMAATEVDSPPIVSTKRLEGSLVAPPTPLPVPNHLTAISESP